MTGQQEFVADLHIHSRYAYACSKNLTLANIASMARVKGIGLLATGDFTHPAWTDELEVNLAPVDSGTFQYEGVNFVLGTEISCVYRQGGRSRRLHLLLLLSSLENVRKFNAELSRRGVKLEGDGRPSVGMSAADLSSLALDVDPEAMVIPAHIWTPWYGMLGSVSGFDSLEECFGHLAPMIRGVETGLSSDPAMNWSVPDISSRAVLSFSDAHSLPNLGREVTVFKGNATFDSLRKAIDENAIAYTVEFYPEEGKYHYDGHRNCGVRQSPRVTAVQGGELCPVCNRPLTLGVLHRVNSLSSTARAGQVEEFGAGPDGLILPPDDRPPFLRLVPLEELLAETLGVGRRSKAVGNVYRRLCAELGSELEVLARANPEDIGKIAGERVARAVLMARTGQVATEPGFDGQYGTVRVWGESSRNPQQASLL
jgi:uncharacterized protein (TIGR00375 family)